MNTTNYTIELLITGICSFIWIAFIFVTVLADQIPTASLDILRSNKVIVALLLIPFVYMVGVLVDRAADELSELFFATPNKEDLRRKRSIIYMHSQQLIDVFEYGKMRMRICRGWMLNGTMIFITGLVYLWSESIFIGDYSTKITLTLLFGLLIIFSVVLAFFGYMKLRQSEQNFLEIQHDIIEREQL